VNSLSQVLPYADFNLFSENLNIKNSIEIHLQTSKEIYGLEVHVGLTTYTNMNMSQIGVGN
jgi:hypothetical protein